MESVLAKVLHHGFAKVFYDAQVQAFLTRGRLKLSLLDNWQTDL